MDLKDLLEKLSTKVFTISAKLINQGTNIYELLSRSFQVVKRLFVLASFNAYVQFD